MGPGRHLRYGRVQLLLNLNRRFFIEQRPTLDVVRKKKNARAISAAGLHTSANLGACPPVYQTDLLSEL